MASVGLSEVPPARTLRDQAIGRNGRLGASSYSSQFRRGASLSGPGVECFGPRAGQNVRKIPAQQRSAIGLKGGDLPVLQTNRDHGPLSDLCDVPYGQGHASGTLEPRGFLTCDRTVIALGFRCRRPEN